MKLMYDGQPVLEALIVRQAEHSFRRAVPSDAPAIAAVVNAATSGSGGIAGWTHEGHLWEGDRTNAAEILSMMKVPEATFLLRLDREEIAGSAYLKPMGTDAYMGMLAVRPLLQSGGVGKQLIAECERIARDEWRSDRMLITVITSHRPELVAFYQRRGYVRTGRRKEFERNHQGARVEGLGLEWMEKRLAPPARRPAGEVRDSGHA